MTDQSDDILELEIQIQQLEAENEALEHAYADLEGQHETEVEGLLAEIALLEERVEQLEAERDHLLNELEQEEPIYGSDEEQAYLASKKRLIFHRPTCEWATYIPPYRLIEFSSHREAVEAGYKPCKTCRA